MRMGGGEFRLVADLYAGIGLLSGAPLPLDILDRGKPRPKFTPINHGLQVTPWAFEFQLDASVWEVSDPPTQSKLLGAAYG